MNIFNRTKSRLIVSCQALPDEPLHSSFIMGRMARAAKEGGAAAIRAQGAEDIREIRKVTGLPVIGLVKCKYEDSAIYITPTMHEVEELLTTDCEMIAIDMTARKRPAGGEAAALVKRVHEAGRLVLADISNEAEGITAVSNGADAVSTTMSGYTPESPQLAGPDYALMQVLSGKLAVPVFGEGRIHTPEEMKQAMGMGIWAPIIGSAITRPQLITKEFVKNL
jgi:N-acylglucosamine-6-phosphate 2-epimerase